MPTYIAFIGHQPAISLAELSAAVPGFRLERVVNGEAAVFESDADLTPKDFHLLGGSIALARVLEGARLGMDDVPDQLRRALNDVKGKATFSLRTTGVHPRKLAELYRRCKDLLKKSNIASRYVGNEREAVSSVALHREGLLDGSHGVEMAIVMEKDRLWIGQTFAAQDVDAYAKRDMQKPVRDMTVGILPPKLAQIMLNFGQWLVMDSFTNATNGDATRNEKRETRNLTVFDPFCGTGVIPLECMVRGWTVLASDVSQKAVSGTEKNLEWIRKEEKIGKRDVPAHVWKQDATKPFKLPLTPDVIVTETTLGPNLKKRALATEIKTLKSENEHLQIAFLKNVKASLPGVPLVVMWPVWYGSKSQTMLEAPLKQLAKLGYEAVLPPGIRPARADRPTLVYRRPEQFVGREIVLLRPVKA